MLTAEMDVAKRRGRVVLKIVSPGFDWNLYIYHRFLRLSQSISVCVSEKTMNPCFSDNRMQIDVEPAARANTSLTLH
jgi:hypothetical protein